MRRILLIMRINRLKRQRKELENYVILHHPDMLAKADSLESTMSGFSILDRSIQRYSALINKKSNRSLQLK
jgi:hypothetical protein